MRSAYNIVNLTAWAMCLRRDQIKMNGECTQICTHRAYAFECMHVWKVWTRARNFHTQIGKWKMLLMSMDLGRVSLFGPTTTRLSSIPLICAIALQMVEYIRVIYYEVYNFSQLEAGMDAWHEDVQNTYQTSSA